MTKEPKRFKGVFCIVVHPVGAPRHYFSQDAGEFLPDQGRATLYDFRASAEKNLKLARKCWNHRDKIEIIDLTEGA